MLPELLTTASEKGVAGRAEGHDHGGVRTPRLIWIFLLWDMIRFGIAAAMSLVVVLAFSFSVKFLADGRLDLLGAVKLTILGLVPMAQYALPFACGLAATLTYHRLSADRETAAAMSCGVSHRALLFPAAICGVILGGAVLFMSHEVIPIFLRRMEKIIQRDLTGMLVRAVEQGQSVRLGPIELSAKSVVRAGPDARVSASERLRLTGVLAATVDDDNRVQGYISAESVNAWFFQETVRGEPSTAIQLVFRGARGEGAGDAIDADSFASQRIRMPGVLIDDPKFQSYRQLQKLRDEPERYAWVESARRALHTRLRSEIAAELIARSLAQNGSVELRRPGGEHLRLSGARLVPDAENWRIEPSRGLTLALQRRLASGTVVDMTAESARLAPSEALLEESDNDSALLDLTLGGVQMHDGRTARAALKLPAVMVAETGPEPPPARTSELLAFARTRPAPSPPLLEAVSTLAARIDDLQREILSKMHERAAYAAAAALTLLCGAVTGIRRRESLALPTYLWSFFPALAAVITVSAGQGLTHAFGPEGLILLWGGVAVLAAVVAVEYARLRRL